MKKALFILLLVFLFGCKPELKENDKPISEIADVIINEESVALSFDSTKLSINFKPKGNYNSIITKIKADKFYFKNLYQTNNNKAIDSASKYIY
ncbi:hypothetical protein [Winogradskyella sp.]|uniref:hypothetical protein n=1 Tax=Winogradskyella sp. TaxID=1883156 RepID=UPI003F6BD505